MTAVCLVNTPALMARLSTSCLGTGSSGVMTCNSWTADVLDGALQHVLRGVGMRRLQGAVCALRNAGLARNPAYAGQRGCGVRYLRVCGPWPHRHPVCDSVWPAAETTADYTRTPTCGQWLPTGVMSAYSRAVLGLQ